MADFIQRAEAALYNAPPWWLAAAFLLVLVGAAEFGHALRRRKHGGAVADDGERDMLTAALGLLALMLAFTFAMAHERYDERRRLVADEAAAIEAAWLQSDLASEPAQSQIREALRSYVDVRLAFFFGEGTPTRVEDYDNRSHAALDRVWRIARGIILAGPERIYLDALARPIEDMARLQEHRRAARTARVPLAVLVALVAYSAIAAGLLGYVMSARRTAYRAASSGLFVLVALAIYLTLDFDNPWSGLIMLSPQPLADVRAEMDRLPLPSPDPGALPLPR